MNKWLLASVVVLALALLGTSLVFNAESPAKEIYMKVPFPFMVGEEIFMSGNYRISPANNVQSSIRVTSWDGTASIEVPVISRLARQDHSGHDTVESLVFDRVGDESFLSEVWMSGKDGYLVRGTDHEHRHTVVPVEHKK